ncbi:putative oxidoreductase -like protein [Trichinella pseudospiralis]|uniref:Putative oxidoreductase-like protein n=3 Tax=Trichinella pseudospiralis TaxID=6337 RepID=A0A0V1E2S5_TRIPS|nr:putative oxidoreductase -like protein [Trichinella pseudospiralis]KRY89414.1 putative oxidoreductase -like protein [Trichinella pseudospiralis]KRZ25105.1 putative oxidoreductase -like protein [Trichinella pseudospiralis]KRZ35985.1 putative oxidoreductase -like protein [Trichinella pseudospiralis]
MQFDNKAALITGATSGIGKATAEYFAKLGCKLALLGRNVAALEETQKNCMKYGSLKKEFVICLQCDVTNSESLKNAVQSTVNHFKQINILVNCAGQFCRGSASTTDIELYDKVMAVNVRSVIQITQLCIPHLIRVGGCIVNVSSTSGMCSYADVAYYCMSKSALDSFTKCLALDLASKNVRVNSVNPGVIVTELHKRGGMNDVEYKQFLERSAKLHPVGRVGDVEEVARTIAFLASDEASFITGELLKVDGGRAIYAPRFNFGASNGVSLPFLSNFPKLKNLFQNPSIGSGFQAGFDNTPGSRGFGVNGGSNILGMFGQQRGFNGGVDSQGTYRGGFGNNWSIMRGLVDGGQNFGGSFNPRTGEVGFSRSGGIGPFFNAERGIKLDFGDLIPRREG